ncbi:hypothetical protein DFH28DRAFT_927070 [Melampsora americana]|nr:hypothetical protein DFH28DRAFT_927070 [Melampsora americana]
MVSKSLTAGVESLFSGMSAQKTKGLSRMNVTTLNMMYQIEMNLQSENPKQPSDPSSRDHTIDQPNDDLKDVQSEDLDQLQEFEDEIHFNNYKDPQNFQLHELYYMDALFNISLFKNEKGLDKEVDKIMVDVSHSPREDEDWNEEDLFVW